MKTGRKKGKVGVQDIAKYLNISASSVSRALNNHPRISKETKDKVMAAAAKLGYNPGMPELMNPEMAEAVAILLPSFDSAFYREVAAGITEYLHSINYHAFIIDTKGNEDQETLFFKTYKKYGISGIIHIVSNRVLPDDFYNFVLNGKLPLVTICQADRAISNISSVLPDVFQGVSKIFNFLNSLKIKSIALILEDSNNPVDNQIEESINNVAESSEMKDISVLYLEREATNFSNNILRLLKRKERPEVIIVKDTLSALTVYNIAQRLGINIPKDMLLIAIGSDYKIENLVSHISLLKMPGFNMGVLAAEILFEQIKDPLADKKSEIIPVNFILKSSSVRM